MIADWLKAGVIEGQVSPRPRGNPTRRGDQPGADERGPARDGTGRRSPLLHQRQQRRDGEAGHPGRDQIRRRPGRPVSLPEQAEQVKAPGAWLAPRGLAFNEDKTRIVHLDDGFDFLGFNVRRYRGKLLIKPSKAAVKRIRARLAAEVKALRGANAAAVITTLNPIIRGWAAYYRTWCPREMFNDLDHYMWELTYRWARRSHRTRGNAGSSHVTSACSTPDQARPVGVRRPRQRPLPAQVLLDEDHPSHPGQGQGVPRRPRPGRLLGSPAPPRETPAGPRQAAAAATAARALPALRTAAAPRRPRAADTPTNGNSGSPRSARRSPTARSPSTRTRGHGPITCSASFTPTAETARQAAPAVDQPLQPHRIAIRACLSRLPETGRPVPRGPRRSNAPSLPDYLGSDDWDYPLGGIQMLGKSDAEQIRANAPHWAGRVPRDAVRGARPPCGRLLALRRGPPAPANRVTLESDGQIRLTLDEKNNIEGLKRLRHKLQRRLGDLGMHEKHLLTTASTCTRACRSARPRTRPARSGSAPTRRAPRST